MNTESNPSPKPQASTLAVRFGLGILLSALSALMLILAFHPYNQWYLALIALVPMRFAEYRLFPVKWSGLGSAIGVGGWLFVFLSRMFGNSGAGQVIQIVVAVIIVIQVFATPGTRRFHERTSYRWFVLEGVTGWVGTE